MGKFLLYYKESPTLLYYYKGGVFVLVFLMQAAFALVG